MIQRSRHDETAIGAERGGINPILMPRERAEFPTGFGIPDSCGMIQRSRHDASAVGAKRSTINGVVVPYELVNDQ